MTSKSREFDHKFQGWSVWVEPCPIETKEIVDEMKQLSVHCGGPNQGTHEFPLHCTLLYNFSPDSSIKMQSNQTRNIDNMYVVNDDDDDDDDDDDEKVRQVIANQLGKDLDKEMGYEMLQICIEKFKACDKLAGRHRSNEDEVSNHEEDDVDTVTLQLNPTDFYFFPYPKQADDGRGFGCVISMLLLEKTHKLQQLHNIVAHVFPPDERHRTTVHEQNENDGTQIKRGIKDDNTVDTQSDKYNSSHNSNRNNSNNSSSNSNNSNRNNSNNKFIPHMALVYAPEIYLDYVNQRTIEMKQTKPHFLKPMQAKYLSLWNTNGMVNEWKLIAKIEL